MSGDSNTITFFFTVVVAFVVIRWFITSETVEGGGEGGVNATAGEGQQQQGPATRTRNLQPVQLNRRPVTQDMVEVVLQIAPHLTPAQVRFDLERTGNVEETVNRALADGTLPFPPGMNLQHAVSSASAPTPAAASPASSSTSSTPKLSSPPSLIDKYNLKDKLFTEVDEDTPAPKLKWSQNKEERQKQLQKQREDMILKARRKLEMKEKNLAA